MMPGLDFSEVLIVIVLALLVLGPKDLPLMMRKLGRFMARMRGLASEFRAGFDDLARQAELDELRREVDALRRTTRDGFSAVTEEFTRPVADARDAVMKPLAAPAPEPGPSTGTASALPAPEAEATPASASPYDPEPPATSPVQTPSQAAGGAR